MRLLLIRHSQAELREDWNDQGFPDILRPLTKVGITRWADAISGLEKLVPRIEQIYTSQCTRAIQTAEMLHTHYKSSELKKIAELNPKNDFKGLKKILQKHDDNDIIAIVGHGSSLSNLLDYFLEEKIKLTVVHKKGGVALLSIREDDVALNWLMTQKQLCYLSSI